ncbi:DNA-3-methyladenine glycosylase [Gracilibacillus sp. S3-1-1]|uniref:DNA-3-methyladenine glycosylase n=1 Tax=Gracilibacillus pellucidus TaxID=3095368 RepID=A0ACC6M7N3_9BACI|nr:DNA-3-methyladenine glycosylase [Gracilibacillus sp. S3-1-1]MDX8046906.1 DNA-3-methyladenine glycosylase [Gracilibacillus sp. S3-1-1]
MWSEKMELETPYDFDYLLFRLEIDTLNHVDRDNRSISVPLRMNETKHVVKVTAKGTTTKPLFIIEGHDEGDKNDLLERIIDIFAWEEDLHVIGNFFAKTDLADLFEMYPATPLIREFDPFHNLMKTIIHQQLNTAFAETLTARFVKKYGEKVDGVWFYPTAEQVANIPYQELREMQFSTRKAEYVIDTAKKIAANELSLTDLYNENDQEVMEQLMKIRGIGAWTAQNWLMFSLSRKDLFPASDIGIRRALQHYLQLDKKPTALQAEEWSRAWKPYRSYATMTLWRSIEET